MSILADSVLQLLIVRVTFDIISALILCYLVLNLRNMKYLLLELGITFLLMVRAVDLYYASLPTSVNTYPREIMLVISSFFILMTSLSCLYEYTHEKRKIRRMINNLKKN